MLPITRRVQDLTAIIERKGDGFVALCPELDVASQGDTIEEARSNLTAAVGLLLEVADATEVEKRLDPFRGNTLGVVG